MEYKPSCFNNNEFISMTSWKTIFDSKTIDADELYCSVDYPIPPCDPIIIIPYQDQKEQQTFCYIRETLIKTLLSKDRIYRWNREIKHWDEHRQKLTVDNLQYPFYQLPYPGIYINQTALEELINIKYWAYSVIPQGKEYVGSGGHNMISAIHTQEIEIYTLKGLSKEEVKHFFEGSISKEDEIFKNPPEIKLANLKEQIEYVNKLRKEQSEFPCFFREEKEKCSTEIDYDKEIMSHLKHTQGYVIEIKEIDNCWGENKDMREIIICEIIAYVWNLKLYISIIFLAIKIMDLIICNVGHNIVFDEDDLVIAALSVYMAEEIISEYEITSITKYLEEEDLSTLLEIVKSLSININTIDKNTFFNKLLPDPKYSTMHLGKLSRSDLSQFDACKLYYLFIVYLSPNIIYTMSDEEIFKELDNAVKIDKDNKVELNSQLIDIINSEKFQDSCFIKQGLNRDLKRFLCK